jgi:hypothetical protein
MRKRAFRVRAALGVQALLIPFVLIACHREATGPAADTGAGAKNSPRAAAKLRILEGYPERVKARLEERSHALGSLPPTIGSHASHYIINVTKRWQPGQTVKIAFRGGDADLHAKIAKTVTKWTEYANLKFDFGYDAAAKKYRSWNTTDKEYLADIRVCFDQSGYYSLVGKDSVTAAIARAGDESLNLEQFDVGLPSDWEAVALHEFGHAIGFEHEHQSPSETCDFRFEDDSGYVKTQDPASGEFVPDSEGRRPGLYTLLGGPPNKWPKSVVDFNLKPLTGDTHAYEMGPFDKKSIMKYYFEDWMFVKGKDSPCFTPGENLLLSDGDQQGAGKVYPFKTEHIESVITQRAKILDEASKMEHLPKAAKELFKEEAKKQTIKKLHP